MWIFLNQPWLTIMKLTLELQQGRGCMWTYSLASLSRSIFQEICTLCISYEPKSHISKRGCLSIKSNLHRLIHLTHLILQCFCQGLYPPSKAFSDTSCIGMLSMSSMDPLLTNSFYTLCAYDVKGSSWTSFPNHHSYPRMQ